MYEIIVFLKKNYLHQQICYLCELLFAEWVIFDPFWYSRMPQKESKIVIGHK